MRAWRYALMTAGVLVLGYGIVQLVRQVPGNLRDIVLWMVAAVVIHDAVLSPLVVAVGWILARTVPARARRYLQATLVTGGLITVIALPIIHRENTQPRSKALLLQNYAGNLAILLTIVGALNLIAYLAAVFRDRRAASTSQPV